VLDNYATHKHKDARKWLARADNQRIALHFTPTTRSRSPGPRTPTKYSTASNA
jgi:hypothetical protein